MLANQSTTADAARQEPFRWSHTNISEALDTFANADSPSQREFAEQHGIPHATFNYWQRHFGPAPDDSVDSFFCSGSGALVLRRIVCAALITFGQRGACGIRLVSDFLHLAQLDRFVACSRGALHPLAAHLESDLGAFADEQQPVLAQQMHSKIIAVAADEHFHEGNNCLVAIEPVSNFILAECYRDHRDAGTWTAAIQEAIKGMPLDIVLLTSDLARGLLCCAEKGLDAAHSPDLFHGQRDLLKPLLLPLARPVQQITQDLEKAERLRTKLDAPLETSQTEAELLALVAAVRQEEILMKQLQQAKERKEEAVQQVRGIGDDYHPFDRETGQPVTAEEVGQRLNGHLEQLQAVVQEADLPYKAQEAMHKSQAWVTTLMGCVAWFWCLATDIVNELDLTAEQEEVIKNKLLSGYYWQMAAGRARTAEEKQRLKQLAEQLQKEAWENAALASLPETERKAVELVAQVTAGLFQRSSSCVEGRNGRLSLQHHGHSRVSPRRLKALTSIHNYLVKRADGTTAAERFFGQKHEDVFSWLLQRMPDLPRPAQKRRQAAA
jgi:hypothetical protein